MYSDTIFCIGDKVTTLGSDEVRTVKAIQILTYIGYRGRVSTDYILYLGRGLWRSARVCTRIETKKKSH